MLKSPIPRGFMGTSEDGDNWPGITAASEFQGCVFCTIKLGVIHCIPLTVQGPYLAQLFLCSLFKGSVGCSSLGASCLLFSVSKVSLKKLCSLPAWTVQPSQTNTFYFPPQEVLRILRQNNPGKQIWEQGLEAQVLKQWWGGKVSPSSRHETSNTSLAVWVWILGVRFQTFPAGWRGDVLPAWSGSFCSKGRAELGEN